MQEDDKASETSKNPQIKEVQEVLTDAAKEARRAYRRKWAKENPEKVRAQQERFWARKAAEQAAKQQDPKSSSPTAGGQQNDI